MDTLKKQYLLYTIFYENSSYFGEFIDSLLRYGTFARISQSSFGLKNHFFRIMIQFGTLLQYHTYNKTASFL